MAMSDSYIPAFPEREIFPPSDDTSTLGADIAENLAAITWHSLCKDAAKINEKSKPSTSATYDSVKGIDYVAHNRGSEHLKVPQALLSMNWKAPPRPTTGAASSFDEIGIGAACTPAYNALASLIQEQLRFGKHEYLLRFSAVAQHALAANARTDFTLTSFDIPSTAVEHKNTLGEGHASFKDFPFHGDTSSRDLADIAIFPQRLLRQIIFYAGKIREETKQRQVERRKVLMALALPPIRFYFIMVDFDHKTVTVFPNAVSSCSTGLAVPPSIAKMVVSPDAWRAYWQTVFWFFIVAVAFNYPTNLKQAYEKEEERFPVELRDVLEHAVEILGEAPPLSPWARLLAWRTLLIRLIYMLWIALMWQALGAPKVLRASQYLRIPSTGKVALRALRNESNLMYFLCPETLPDCLARWSDKTKRFYVYPKLGLFIKIFSESIHQCFEAEVNTFNRLSDIQGMGIPCLYASGKIMEGDEFYLIMSYEGEPLEEWNTEDRHQVTKLVSLLHQYHVHHHDIAQRNVVVDKKGKFTLIDFEQSEVRCRRPDCTEGMDLGIRDESDHSYYLG